jgi:hypothetical protein
LIVFLIFLVVVVADDDDDDDDEEEETSIERERCDLFFLEAAAVVEKVAPATDAEEERAARIAPGVVVNIVAKEKRC